MKKIFIYCRSILAALFIVSQFSYVYGEENLANFYLGELQSLDLSELLAADVQVTSAMKRCVLN
jgi:hypothetical protein